MSDDDAIAEIVGESEKARKRRAEDHLTDKADKFARAYVENGGKGPEAYIKAGYGTPDMERRAIRKKVSALLKNRKVAQRIRMLRNSAALRSDVTVDYVVQRLKSNAEKAAELGDFAASNKSLELLAKYLQIIETTKHDRYGSTAPQAQGPATINLNLGFLTDKVDVDVKRLANAAGFKLVEDAEVEVVGPREPPS